MASSQLSGYQRFFRAIFPKSWSESMERESREWQAICPCGHKRSIWDLGGIRWKAAGNPRRRIGCPACGETRWHTIVRERNSTVPTAHG